MDIQIDDVALWIGIVAPNALQELISREHLPPVPHHRLQHGELARRQIDDLITPDDYATRKVDTYRSNLLYLFDQRAVCAASE